MKFTIKSKTKILEDAGKIGAVAAAKKHNVSVPTIYNWRNQARIKAKFAKLKDQPTMEQANQKLKHAEILIQLYKRSHEILTMLHQLEKEFKVIEQKIKVAEHEHIGTK